MESLAFALSNISLSANETGGKSHSSWHSLRYITYDSTQHGRWRVTAPTVCPLRWTMGQETQTKSFTLTHLPAMRLADVGTSTEARDLVFTLTGKLFPPTCHFLLSYLLQTQAYSPWLRLRFTSRQPQIVRDSATSLA